MHASRNLIALHHGGMGCNERGPPCNGCHICLVFALTLSAAASRRAAPRACHWPGSSPGSPRGSEPRGTACTGADATAIWDECAGRRASPLHRLARLQTSVDTSRCAGLLRPTLAGFQAHQCHPAPPLAGELPGLPVVGGTFLPVYSIDAGEVAGGQGAAVAERHGLAKLAGVHLASWVAPEVAGGLAQGSLHQGTHVTCGQEAGSALGDGRRLAVMGQVRPYCRVAA